MGDAGPPTPLLEDAQIPITIPAASQEPIRDIHVLVTGFGPFKSFNINPSWLVANALPTELSALPPTTSKPQDSTPQLQRRNPIAPHTPYTSLQRPPSTETPSQQPFQQTLRPANHQPYRIVLHTHPQPVRVSYHTVSHLIPTLLIEDPPKSTPTSTSIPHSKDYDYIFHIGLASGRDSYTLETLGRRTGYTIPDVDDEVGDTITAPLPHWQEGVAPEVLHVGWNAADVLRRWEGEVDRRHAELESGILQQQLDQLGKNSTGTSTSAASDVGDNTRSATSDTTGVSGIRSWMANHGMFLRGMTMTGPSATQHRPGVPRKPVVKLSRDAGRFLCEFILMTSLIERYVAAQVADGLSSVTAVDADTADVPVKDTQLQRPAYAQGPFQGESHVQARPRPQVQNYTQSQTTPPREKLGKVAFLHVPNGIEAADVDRGVMVAESAIRALVASWEGGERNEGVYKREGDDVVDRERSGMGKRIALETAGKGAAFEEVGTGDR